MTLAAIGILAAILLVDKHLPLVLASRRPRPSRGFIERVFAPRWKTDPPS